jgi:hypothetical protein
MAEMTEKDRRYNMIGSLIMTGLAIIAGSALAIACWAGLT